MAVSSTKMVYAVRMPTLRQFVLAWAFAVVIAMLVVAVINGRW